MSSVRSGDLEESDRPLVPVGADLSDMCERAGGGGVMSVKIEVEFYCDNGGCKKACLLDGEICPFLKIKPKRIIEEVQKE